MKSVYEFTPTNMTPRAFESALHQIREAHAEGSPSAVREAALVVRECLRSNGYGTGLDLLDLIVSGRAVAGPDTSGDGEAA